MQDTLTPTLLEKEAIANLSFKNSVDFKQKPDLRQKLEDAARLGNTAKVKFKIDFFSDSGFNTVETTIWATGNKFICLKGGLWLPVSKIVDLRPL